MRTRGMSTPDLTDDERSRFITWLRDRAEQHKQKCGSREPNVSLSHQAIVGTLVATANYIEHQLNVENYPTEMLSMEEWREQSK